MITSENIELNLRLFSSTEYPPPSGEVYYVRTLGQFVKSVFKYPPSQSNKSKWLKARGYKISQGKYHWKFIRNGSYYLPPYLDKPVIKQGINLYIYEEDC